MDALPETGRHRSPDARISDAEWRQRVDLAACYRLADRYHLGKIIWNHITARVPDAPDQILVFRLGCRYDEVTASNLMKFTLDGRPVDAAGSDLNQAAFVIHGGLYRARPEINCVMHTHSRGGQGVSILKEGLLPLSQEALSVYDDLAYHDYEGLSDDVAESERLARNLGGMNQMILRNHGLITAGKSVGEAFWRMYILERACALQMDVLATGRELVVPPPELCRKVRAQYDSDFPAGHFEWPALLRELERDCPDYAT